MAKKEPLVNRLRAYNGDCHVTALLEEAAKRIEQLEKLDHEAASHVESVICMRTEFTGDPPYVGWKGLGLALNEALDERDALRLEARDALLMQAVEWFEMHRPQWGPGTLPTWFVDARNRQS